jgi:hypothetical protein
MSAGAGSLRTAVRSPVGAGRVDGRYKRFYKRFLHLQDGYKRHELLYNILTSGHPRVATDIVRYIATHVVIACGWRRCRVLGLERSWQLLVGPCFIFR